MAITERMMARILVIHDGAAWEYSIAAMAAPVIGNVYAHQDNVNLRGLRYGLGLGCASEVNPAQNQGCGRTEYFRSPVSNSATF